MQTKIIQAGNSQVVLIPDVLIEQYNLGETVEITPTVDGILIHSSPKRRLREGWEEKIREIHKKSGPYEPDGEW